MKEKFPGHAKILGLAVSGGMMLGAGHTDTAVTPNSRPPEAAASLITPHSLSLQSAFTLLDELLLKTDGSYSLELTTLNGVGVEYARLGGVSKFTPRAFVTCEQIRIPACEIVAVSAQHETAIEWYKQWLENDKPEITWSDFIEIPPYPGGWRYGTEDYKEWWEAEGKRQNVARSLERFIHELTHVYDFLHNGEIDGSPLGDALKDHPDPMHGYTDEVMKTGKLQNSQ